MLCLVRTVSLFIWNQYYLIPSILLPNLGPSLMKNGKENMFINVRLLNNVKLQLPEFAEKYQQCYWKGPMTWRKAHWPKNSIHWPEKQAMNDPRLNNGTSSCNNIAWKKTFHVPGIWNIAGLQYILLPIRNNIIA